MILNDLHEVLLYKTYAILISPKGDKNAIIFTAKILHLQNTNLK